MAYTNIIDSEFLTFTANQALTNAKTPPTGYGTSGQVLTSQGAGTAPQWAAAGGGGLPTTPTTTRGAPYYLGTFDGSGTNTLMWGCTIKPQFQQLLAGSGASTMPPFGGSADNRPHYFDDRPWMYRDFQGGGGNLCATGEYYKQGFSATNGGKYYYSFYFPRGWASPSGAAYGPTLGWYDWVNISGISIASYLTPASGSNPGLMGWKPGVGANNLVFSAAGNQSSAFTGIAAPWTNLIFSVGVDTTGGTTNDCHFWCHAASNYSQVTHQSVTFTDSSLTTAGQFRPYLAISPNGDNAFGSSVQLMSIGYPPSTATGLSGWTYYYEQYI